MAEEAFDLAVVGSAFGGSMMAMLARRLGRSVVMIERGRHPRFAIGESSTPLTNLLWEELSDAYQLPRLRPLSKWSSWQKNYPEIGCGLKRGFTFYHHRFDETWTPHPERENELLVGASPNDSLADTHWYRPDFDAFLVREAQAMGVSYWDETELSDFKERESEVVLSGTRLGAPMTFRARFLIDASGPRGFLWNRLRLPESRFKDFPATQALYSHFRGVNRWEQLHPPTEVPPYPPDDAALHHVFPGGWMWVLRFNNGITSAGVSVQEPLGRELGIADGADAWARLLKRLPAVAAQFRDVETIRPFAVHERLAFYCPVVTGSRWAMLPSAAGFVDPLLSTGFPMTLLGVGRLAKLFSKSLVPPRTELDTYAEETRADLEYVAGVVGALHQNLGRPRIFQSLGMLYFAAASYSESARRLGRGAWAPGFLLRNHPTFRKMLEELCAGSLQDETTPKRVMSSVSEMIEPFNVAGLCQPEKRNWYGVAWGDLITNREKLGASISEVEALRLRLGVST